MGKIYYSCPLPEEKLIERFKPVFKKLTGGFNATILSIPHLGHTSHLRYINSSKITQHKLGLENELFVFIDRDKVVSGYESFASELLIGINEDNTNSHAINSQNGYVLNNEIVTQVKRITETKSIIIGLVVDGKTKEFISEIENIFLLMQKTASNYPVAILWITDTKTARDHKHTHPSSTFLTNITFQKNFDKQETDYCLQRIATLKGEKISNVIINNSLDLTGGFACTFHQFVNTGDILKSDYVKSSLSEIQNEVRLNNELVNKGGLHFIENLDIAEIEFESIKLRSNPTSQEINLIGVLQKNIGEPISRDQIAEAIWGKSWNTKYSDWAIDKAVSRLRKNILSGNYKVITVKNLGYELMNNPAAEPTGYQRSMALG